MQVEKPGCISGCLEALADGANDLLLLVRGQFGWATHLDAPIAGGSKAARVRSRTIDRSNSAFCGAPQNADDAEGAIMQSHTAEVAVWPAVS
jgi:hypothetical protein